MKPDNLLQTPAQVQPADPVLSVPLDAIILDAHNQPRGWTIGVYDLDVDHLERLAASDPKTWPPLLVKPAEKSGFFYLLDGWHRYFTARKRFNLTVLPCLVKPDGNILDAVRANLSHGLPLSNADRKACAVWLYNALPADHKPSYRALAREVGLSHNTIRAAIETAGQIDQQATNERGNLPPDNGLQQVSRFLSRAARDWGGLNPLWGGSADHQRANHIRKLLEAAPPEKRSQLLQECEEWGAALVAGARLYHDTPVHTPGSA